MNDDLEIVNEQQFILGLIDFGICSIISSRQLSRVNIIIMQNDEQQKDFYAALCDDLSQGMSVVEACAKNGISKAQVYRRLARDKDFKTLYDTAQVDKLYTKLHECVDLCDSVLDAGKDDNNKVQAVKLKVNTIQWFASHMFAKQFGNKTIHSNDPDNPMPAMQIYCPKEEKSE